MIPLLPSVLTVHSGVTTAHSVAHQVSCQVVKSGLCRKSCCGLGLWLCKDVGSGLGSGYYRTGAGKQGRSRGQARPRLRRDKPPNGSRQPGHGPGSMLLRRCFDAACRPGQAGTGAGQGRQRQPETRGGGGPKRGGERGKNLATQQISGGGIRGGRATSGPVSGVVRLPESSASVLVVHGIAGGTVSLTAVRCGILRI